MLPELTNRILGGWDDLFPGMHRPDGIHYLGIPGSVEGGTTSFLGFSSGKRKPLFAVKIHRQNNTKKRALNERNILRYLRSCGGRFAASIPRLILCDNIAGAWVFAQSVLDGRPMVGTMTPDGIPKIQDATANIQLAADWLVELHSVTRDNSKTSIDLLKQDGLDTLDKFSNSFDLLSKERDYLSFIRDELSGVETVVQHGDFCRHNILVTRNTGGQEIRVIDWTDSKRPGSPLHDLFFFLTTYYLQVRKDSGLKGFTRAFEQIFFERTPYSTIVKDCVTEFCTRVNVDISKVRTLFALFLIERAVFEYLQVAQCARYGGLPRFTLYLAGIENLDYPEAMKAQYWIHFFKMFVTRWRDFIV